MLGVAARTVKMNLHAVLILLTGTLLGCQHPRPLSRAPGTPMQPDVYPPGTKVSLVMRFVSPDSIQLGPRSAQLFLDMLARPSVHTRISSMPAAPMGTFTVGDENYLWHGNAVIRGTGDDERLWHGPFTQRLISEFMGSVHNTRESVLAVLNAIESDPAVADTPVQGPGAYPRGGDALHTVPISQFKTFTPQPKPK